MKKDNKGFSLVELIIVIAIMAILVGIVGSQVLPYLNKSREAKDQQILSGWVTAALSAYSANAASLTDGSYEITVSCSNGAVSGATCTSGTNCGILQQSFIELAAPSGAKFSSKLYQKITPSVVLLVTPTDPTYIVRIKTIGGISSPDTIATTELVAK